MNFPGGFSAKLFPDAIPHSILSLLRHGRAFVARSVLVQRKSLLYAGAGYLSVAVFQITDNHFRDEWSWPLLLMLSGTVLGVIALWSRKLAERAQARQADD